MSAILQSGLRLLALLWTLLITALIGNVMANNVNARSSATKAINFAMFVAAWSWVAGLYGLVTALFASLAIFPVLIFFDVLAVLLNFIGAIVLSAKLRAIDCGNINEDHLPRSWIAFGSHNNEKRCREIQASLVFMWFLFATFSVLLFFTISNARGGLGGGMSFGRRKHAPAKPSMAQVGP